MLCNPILATHIASIHVSCFVFKPSIISVSNKNSRGVVQNAYTMHAYTHTFHLQVHLECSFPQSPPFPGWPQLAGWNVKNVLEIMKGDQYEPGPSMAKYLMISLLGSGAKASNRGFANCNTHKYILFSLHASCFNLCLFSAPVFLCRHCLYLCATLKKINLQNNLPLK